MAAVKKYFKKKMLEGEVRPSPISTSIPVITSKKFW